MSWEILAVLTLAGLMHASWHALVKVEGDKFLVYSVINLVGLLAGLVMLGFVPPPASLAGIWWLVPAGLLHLIYKIVLIKAYSRGDFGSVFPISRGIAPFLITIGAAFFAGETLTVPQIVLVSCVSLGILVISVGDIRALAGRKSAVGLALLSGGITAAYTIVDGLGARALGNPFWFMAWLYIIDGIIFPAIVIMYRGRDFLSFVQTRWLSALSAGILSMAAYGAVIWAISCASMSGVAVIREISVLFASIIGAVLLKESYGKRRIIGSMLIMGGVIGSFVIARTM